MPPPSSYVQIPDLLPLVAIGWTYSVSVFEFNVANEIWFRYDTDSDPVAFGWFPGTSTGFSPATNLYESDGTTLVTGNTGMNSLWYPLANNSTYYIRIRNNPSGSIAFGFNVKFEGYIINPGTQLDGSFLINDDSDLPGGNNGFPIIVNNPDGTIQGFVNSVPAGEIGDTLPDGTSLWHDRFEMYGGQLALINSLMQFVDDLTPSPALSGFPNICNDGTFFYVIDRATGNIYKVTVSPVSISASIYTLPRVSQQECVGISRDALFIFWAEGYEDGNIYKAAIGLGPRETIYSIPGFQPGIDYIGLTATNNHPGELLVLIDGTLVTYWYDGSEGVSHILHLEADGTLLQDIEISPALGEVNHIHYSPDGASAIRVWLFGPGGNDSTGKYGNLVFATEIFSTIVDTPNFSSGENRVGANGTIFGPSASCTMVTFKYPGSETPPIDAEITVIKQIESDDPDNELEFQFIAGGMDPINFTLKNGESITFSGLANGTYSVVELAEPGYTTTYTVSNGDNNNSITVVAGDSVVVTVVNVPITNGGIYKLVPGKRNDTLWVNVETLETEDVKIPNPGGRTAMIGG